MPKSFQQAAVGPGQKNESVWLILHLNKMLDDTLTNLFMLIIIIIFAMFVFYS